MNNSKLIKVLKTLNKSEFKQFGKLVHSPYFSSSRNVIPLFKIFNKYYPRFDSENFNSENILLELSICGYKSNNQHLKTQMSEMYKLAEQFLTYQRASIHTGLNTFFFAGNCLNRGLYKIGESKMISSVKKIESRGIGHWFYLNYFYAGAMAKTYHEIKGAYNKTMPLYHHDSEILLHQFLSNAAHYISSIAELAIEFKFDTGHNLLFNFLSKTDFEKLLVELRKKNDNYSKASSIYIYLILTYIKFLNKGTTNYFELKGVLFKNISIFDAFERGFFVHAVYWLLENMAKGKQYTKFTKETFDVINFRLENNLYRRTAADHFAVSLFCSFFSTGFKLKELSWLKNYKKKYILELPADERENCDAWTDIFISFLESNYIECLNKINYYKNFILLYTYPVKRLQLMAFYELNYITEAFYAIDAFKSFLRQNKKVSEEFMESNTNFIRFYSKLLKHKHGEKELNLKQILAEVKNSSTDNQEWIIEKINEM